MDFPGTLIGLNGDGRDGVASGDTASLIVGSVLRFVVLVLFILAVAWIVREIIRAVDGGRAHRPASPSPALAELELHYVRGEVSREDYLTRRADLGGSPASAPPPPAV